MVSHYRFKNASTRKRFWQWGTDPNIRPAPLRKMAHVSSRISDEDWKTMFMTLMARLNWVNQDFAHKNIERFGSLIGAPKARRSRNRTNLRAPRWDPNGILGRRSQ